MLKSLREPSWALWQKGARMRPQSGLEGKLKDTNQYTLAWCVDKLVCIYLSLFSSYEFAQTVKLVLFPKMA